MSRPHRSVSVLACLAMLALFTAWPTASEAGGLLLPGRPGERVGEELGLDRLRIEVDVQGDVARVRVEQTWRNLSPRSREVDWVLPLPPGQIARDPSWFDGESRREAEWLDADAARTWWRERLRTRPEAALIEFIGHPLLRAEGITLRPGDARRIVMRYEVALQPDERRRDLVVPLRGARLIGEAAERVEIDVRLNADTAIGPVYSPTHDLVIDRERPGAVLATLRGGAELLIDDLSISWTHTANPVDGMLLTWWPDASPVGYFAFVAASTRVPGSDLPRLPQDVTIILDRSGSMAGERLEGVRRGLRQVLSTLGPDDRVNLVSYAESVDALFERPMPLDPEREAKALDFLARVRARGSANLSQALVAALAGVTPSVRPHHVVLITDSRPTPEPPQADDAGDALSKLLRERDARLWVLALGVDLDASHLERLVFQTRGRLWIPAPGEREEEALLTLTRPLREPVLSDVHVDFRALGSRQVMGPHRALLAAGQQLCWVGRYSRGGRPSIELGGREGAIERIFPYEMPALQRGAAGGHAQIARLFALRRSALRIDALRFTPGPADDSAAQELVNATTGHAVVTEATAFLGSEHDTVGGTGAAVAEVRRVLQNLTNLGQHPGAVAFAANQARRREAWRVPSEGQRFLVAAQRELSWVPTSGLRWRGGRAFLYRRTQGWVEAGLSALPPDEVIVRWTPRFFDLLDQADGALCDALAQRRLLTLQIDDRRIRIVDAP